MTCIGGFVTGARATTLHKQTMEFMKPLYRDLRQLEIPGDMLAGLCMIVEAIENRNYLRAYDIYMRLAVGAPPPAQPGRREQVHNAAPRTARIDGHWLLHAR